MNSNKGFNLLTVIVIICITSIASAITVGVIVTNSYNNTLGLTYKDLADDENLSEFLDMYSKLTSNYYEDIDKEKMLDSAIDAMLNYLGDTYTTYLNENETQQLNDRLSGTYEGIGVIISGNEIIKVNEDTPASKAGLMAEDKILTVNGIDVTNYTSGALSILITHSDSKLIEMTVQRGEEELVFYVELATLINNDATYTMDKNNIGYLGLKVFSKTLDSQVKSALEDLESQGMERLIIDLRDNTGGYLEITENIANLFLDNGKLIYSLEDKDGKEDHYDTTDQKTNYPIVILMNSSSASASEILASALKDSYGAVIVGKTSYGKGKVQQTYDLSNGSKAKYTSAKWLRPNGECIDGVGIIPDYEVDMEYIYNEEGQEVGYRDTQLSQAIEIISAM